MRMNFYKYQGAGNDFIILDGRQSIPALTSEQIRKLCDRRFGVGADGLMVLLSDSSSDFRMLYYNSDGNPGSMCGNGGRCLVNFARSKGYIGQQTTFLASDGLHTATCLPDHQVSLLMADVENITEIDSQSYFLNTGSPHVVVWVTDVMSVDVVKQGRLIRNSDRFVDDGTNVNFVEVKGEKLYVRTYERGVEDETLSCGTGVTASVLAAVYARKISGNSGSISVVTRGGNLSVGFKQTNTGFSSVRLIGPAEFVYEGVIEL